jgi:hypothetical protein
LRPSAAPGRRPIWLPRQRSRRRATRSRRSVPYRQAIRLPGSGWLVLANPSRQTRRHHPWAGRHLRREARPHPAGRLRLRVPRGSRWFGATVQLRRARSILGRRIGRARRRGPAMRARRGARFGVGVRLPRAKPGGLAVQLRRARRGGLAVRLPRARPGGLAVRLPRARRRRGRVRGRSRWAVRIRRLRFRRLGFRPRARHLGRPMWSPSGRSVPVWGSARRSSGRGSRLPAAISDQRGGVAGRLAWAGRVRCGRAERGVGGPSAVWAGRARCGRADCGVGEPTAAWASRLGGY